jgi:hypothetical protein
VSVCGAAIAATGSNPATQNDLLIEFPNARSVYEDDGPMIRQWLRQVFGLGGSSPWMTTSHQFLAVSGPL